MPFAKGTPRELHHSPDWQEKKKGVKKKNKNDRMPLTQPNPLSVQEAAPRAH